VRPNEGKNRTKLLLGGVGSNISANDKLVIVAAWGLNATGTMRISYCQNIKRSAQTVLHSMFHICFHLDLSSSSSIGAACFCFSRTDGSLWAKAEVTVKTRQVLRGLGFRSAGLLRERISAVKRNRRTKAVAEIIDSGCFPTSWIPEGVVGLPLRQTYCLTSTQGLPTTGANKKGQSSVFVRASGDRRKVRLFGWHDENRGAIQ
jgi:hypothetical protein